MAGRTPWARIRHKGTDAYEATLILRHRERDGDAASARVERLIEAAEKLGFDLDAASTGRRPISGDETHPADPEDSGR
jgi:hypothetical protein